LWQMEEQAERWQPGVKYGWNGSISIFAVELLGHSM